jgi:hypothetical protein
MTLDKSLIIAFGMVALLLACTLFAPREPGGPARSSGQENLLFQDDFSNPASGWTTQQSEGITLEYAESGFRIFVDNQVLPNAYPSAMIERTFGDVRIEADVRRISGSDSAKAALICRRADPNHYVLGDIDANGIARLGTFADDLFDILGYEEGTAGLQEGSNHLRLDCIGSTAALYVNGTLVVSAEVDGPSQGSVGFAAGRSGEGQSDFRFDHFIVYKP